MPFRFPLQAVLHLRESVERQQQLELAAANQQVAGVSRLLEQVDRSIFDCQQESLRMLEFGTSAAALRFALELESGLRAKQTNLQQELARVTLLRDQQQQAFQRCRRERQTLETLRERQWLEYRRDQDRREQKRLDALFLSRQAYLERG